MKKIFFLIVSILFSANISHSQNYNWITPNKTYLKLYVADDGIYRIAKSDFTNAGINTSLIDPRTVKVYNKGVQIPIYFEGESDGDFGVNDFLDFYGIRNYGGLTKTYSEDNTLKYTTNEYFNLYSDTNAYWIGWDGANGLRMQISNYSSPNQYSPEYFYDLAHFEKDKYYTIGEVLNLVNDFRNFTNEKFLGEGWYWTMLNNFGNVNNLSISDTISTPLLYPVPQNATIRIFAYPENVSTSIFNEHRLQIKVNGNLISTSTVNDFKRIDTTITFSSSLLSGSGVNTLTATYDPAPGFETSGAMNFDLFELQYPKIFKIRNSQALITLSGSDTTSKQFNVSGYNSISAINIYDVANGIKINSYTSNLDTVKFTGKSNGKFEIINKNIGKKPFKIIQRQVPDYVSNSNGADYLLVYNTLFESQASQLKNYRETHDNFRVTKAEIQDIYDIFNYGIENPAGLKNFVKYVYNSWQLPKLNYICLFGRGSLDPKKNSSATVYYKNLIPVYGNPTSDNYFGNTNGGGFAYYDQIPIGRLSAYTTTDAQNMVDNIITYESQVPQNWWKTFTFIAGGADLNEQGLFLPLNDSLILPYILPPPVSGNPVRIYRNDYNGGVTYNFADSIKNQINRGTLTINFMGHAGSQDWEIGLHDPNILSNFNGKFPLIFSMTCYTGKIAEPNFRVFGERFMTMSNKGSIGYVGTSGWGFVYSGSVFNQLMYKAFATDTIRRIGEIFSYASKKISSDSTGFSFRHTMNCYTLQGDPAVKLLLPKNPEYHITGDDYILSNEYPVINEPVTLTIYPKNYGLFSDSCKIRFQLIRNASNYLTKDTAIRNFKFLDSVKFYFALNVNDTYNASVELDYPNYNPNEYKNDNILNFSMSTKNVLYIPILPVNNSIVRTSNVELVGLNPFINSVKNSIKLLLELDTTKNFNSPLKQMFANSSLKGVSTKFNATLPVLDTNIFYYWRTNSIINGDSSGWSMNQIFRYNPLLVSDNNNKFSTDTNTTVYKYKSAQFSGGDFYNTNFINGGIKLNEFTGNLYIRSFGSNGSEASFFNIIDKSIHIDAGLNTGLNLLKIRRLDGAIIQFKNFKMTFPNSSDSILNFLNTFDSTHILMGLNAAWVQNTYLLNANAISKFAQFGSTQVQNFRIGWFDTWSFIGYLNAPPAEVSEDMHRYLGSWIESISSVDRTFKNNSGTVSYVVGPSNFWKDFSWQNIIVPGTSIKFDVYGINRNGIQNLLLSDLTTNNLVNLSSINAYNYPSLNLIAKLIADTLSGLQSPTLNSFKLNYTPPAEIIPNSISLWQSDTILSVGQDIKIKFDYYNAGNISIPGVIVNLYKTSVSPENTIKSDTIINELKVDSSYTYYKKFTVPYIRNSGSGSAKFTAEIMPLGQNNEFYSFNNILDFYIKLKENRVSTSVNLYSDGLLIQSGDYVRQKPELKVEFKNIKTNFNLLADTSRTVLILNNTYIPYYVNGNVNSIFKIIDKDNIDVNNNQQKSLLIYPSLTYGENNLKVISKNEQDNIDTSDFTVLVSNELMIKDFYNYPNPMKDETSFIVNLLGSEIPITSKIRIYTVSGRLIKEINYSVNIGYNQIPWDGRDNDGDEVANGTYLYKFISEDNVKNETAIQKLVVLR